MSIFRVIGPTSSGAAALLCRLRCCGRRRALPYSARSASVGCGFWIPDGGGAGALVPLSHSQGWSGSSPEPERVRGVFGYQYLSFTPYNPTEGSRSSLGPGRVHTHAMLVRAAQR
eukprot:3793441-Pleurochrysis_carterae.AAC.1